MVDEKIIYKGDDTDFGGGCLMRVKIINPLGIELSKIKIQIGCVEKYYYPPFEEYLIVNLSSEETKCIKDVNTGYLAAFDKDGKQRTAEGKVIIKAKNKVV